VSFGVMEDDAKPTIIGALLTLLLIVSFFYLWYRANIIVKSPSQQIPSVPILLPVLQASAEAKVNGVDTGKLSDVSGGDKTGIAYRRISQDLFQVAVVADLPDPPARSFYQAWLAQGSPKDANYTVFSLGEMKRDESGKWFVELQSNQNRGNLWQVHITEEKAADDSPEKYILSGKLPVRL